jgi:hypothetical protein
MVVGKINFFLINLSEKKNFLKKLDSVDIDDSFSVAIWDDPNSVNPLDKAAGHYSHNANSWGTFGDCTLTLMH